MNLKVIHIVFVGSAVLLALFFGGWCLAQGAEFFALGVGSFVVAAALVVYGFWFWRKITTPQEEWERRRKLFRTVPVVVGLWLFGSEQAAWACSVCYGAAEGSMIDAARVGVWFLLGGGARDAGRLRSLLSPCPAPRASFANRPSAALVEHG